MTRKTLIPLIRTRTGARLNARPLARTARTAAWALAATLGLAAGCANHSRLDSSAEPVATRPSVTVFPIQMAGAPREDVAKVVAVMLEQRGMESIEVEDTVFASDPDATFEAQASAFAAFVKERDLSTEYALYGAVLGSPQRGVDEIRAVLVDNSGTIAWSERQTRESRALKAAKPADPMSCTVFLVDRLHEPLDLLEPSEDRAAGGRWEERGRRESLIPADDEFDAMDARVARLTEMKPAPTVLVYPARTNDTWSAECAARLAAEINARGMLRATVADSRLEFEVQRSPNQQKVLWSGARSIQELVRTNHPEADYILVADYLMSGRTGEAMGVHTFLLDASGDWVVVDFQNSHHKDFNRIRPRSLERCCDLSVVRLERRLRS